MSDYPRYDVAVFVGRFRPLHSGHAAVIREAFERADHVVCVIGSADQARDPRNPFTSEEVAEMLRRFNPAIITVRQRDVGNPALWCSEVSEKVYAATNAYVETENPRIALIGHSKDQSSYYLKMFPQWESIEVENFADINAADIRNDLYTYTQPRQAVIDLLANEAIPSTTAHFLADWIADGHLEQLREERSFMLRYLSQFDCEGNRQYGIKPKFYTCDNVVLHSGHILLVKRGAMPGMGLWALPGGHVDDHESAEQASLRELREETRIDVPNRVLRASLTAPYRSTRGRTITNAFVYRLEAEPKGSRREVSLPRVKGGDDAKKAQWFPVTRVLREMRGQLMEDHALIIEWAVNQIKGDY
jgi:bifunctional NMN adenylyltransferase/nudix hydrolase